MIHVTLNLSLVFDFLWILDSSDDVAVKWAPWKRCGGKMGSVKTGHLYISKH